MRPCVLLLVCFAVAPLYAQAQPEGAYGANTGALSDGQICGVLPCTCGEVQAMAVGCKCTMGAVGPASGAFTCPRDEASTGISGTTWGLVAVALLVGLMLILRRHRLKRKDVPHRGLDQSAGSGQ